MSWYSINKATGGRGGELPFMYKGLTKDIDAGLVSIFI